MLVPFKRSKLAMLVGMAILSSSVILGGCTPGDDGVDGANGTQGLNGSQGQQGEQGIQGVQGDTGKDLTAETASLKRLAALPAGSEATGLVVSSAGDLFFNVQHPSTSNTAPFNEAAVGAIIGLNINTLSHDFEELAVPSSAVDKQNVTTAQGHYQVLLQEGDLLASSGDIVGQITTADGSAVIKQSNDPDFNAFLETKSDGTKGYLFTNWEDRPGGMSRIEIEKNALTGQWTVGNGLMIDFSAVSGTWVNCFGTMSPWGTPLTSEELYFDETANWFDATNSNPQSLASYLGYPTDGTGEWPNPYRYGYIVEITDPTGLPTPVKVFTTGRFSHENAVVMPDNKTVYLSDDGTDVVFFKFVADVADDLSAGTLYAAKFTQVMGAVEEKDFKFGIEWIELAHGDNTSIESWIAEYDSATVAAPSYVTDADIAAWAADKLDNGVLDTVTDERVAFLESRKAAKALGATAEFTKMEGVNINYDAAKAGTVPYIYMAMADVKSGMSDGMGDINIPENRCGIVYRMRLDASFNVNAMEPVVIGGPYDSSHPSNTCATNNVASPDNVEVLSDGRILIGEDTSKHENNMVWVWKQN